MRMYQEAEVEALLDYRGCIETVRSLMAELSGDQKKQPLREILHLGAGKLFALMPGFLPNASGVGCKVITAYQNPGRPGRSSHRGVVTLFDEENGNILAVADAHAITAIRTGAASAVATDLLARADARRLLVMGCGTQARSHIQAIAQVRELERVEVWGRSLERVTAFCKALGSEIGRELVPVADAAEAAFRADMICTVTSAPTPILKGDWVRPGTHVNVVGSSHAGPVEVDSRLVVNSRYFVDSKASALAAAAEFLVARQEGLIADDHIVAEVGDVLLGRCEGRRNEAEITIYKSLGHIVQDLGSLRYVHERAQALSAHAPASGS